MRLIFAVLIITGISALPASAHYMWITIEQAKNGAATSNAYFEESPAAGNGEYLDHFTKTMKMWTRTVEEPKAKLISATVTSQGKNKWLQATLDNSAPRSVSCYGKFGVYRYGKTDVLLHYYARFLELSSHEELHELGRTDHLKLQLIPHDHGQDLKLTLEWQGKPAAGRPVYIRGPKKFRKTLKTNDDGEVEFTPEHPGSYVIRSFVELDEPGKDGDDEYSLIRHHSSLIMKFPLEK